MTISAAAVSTPAAAEQPARAMLLVGALGVVFGDIGTSPIYAFRESLRAAGAVEAQATVLGILSLVFWAVVLVVALKYVVFVMRADNHGEGGTMALISLALPAAGSLRTVLLVIGLGGASLFFGDAMITPAISVLSAIEGLQIATPIFRPYVVPVAGLVLIVLFAIQRRGSGRVGRLFGPVMAAWFVVLGLAGLTAVATVIASQAVISGAFTLVQQAIQLGAVPRLDVRQTSEESAGQVYVPQINWLLVAAVLGLVFGFRSSDALANAYGIAVAGDMLVTSVLVATVARGVWRWPLHLLLPVAGLFLALDFTFVSANLHKIPDGGWFPLMVGAAALSLMLIWRRGRAVALAHRSADAMPLDAFLTSLAQPGAPVRVPGTAVYLTTQHDLVPSALALNLKHNGVLHERLVLLKVTTERAPRVSETARVVVEELSTGIRRVELRFGFAEKPDVPAALQAHAEEVGCDPATASFFLGREVPVPSLRPEVPLWQERIYAFMVRNAVSAPDYFLIPPQRVVELGTRVEI